MNLERLSIPRKAGASVLAPYVQKQRFGRLINYLPGKRPTTRRGLAAEKRPSLLVLVHRLWLRCVGFWSTIHCGCE